MGPSIILVSKAPPHSIFYIFERLLCQYANTEDLNSEIAH